MLALIALLLAVVVFILLYVFIMSGKTKEQTVKDRVRALDQSMNPEKMARYMEDGLNQPIGVRLTGTLIAKYSELAAKITPRQWYKLAEMKLEQSGGFRWGIQGFVFIWLAIAGLLPILVIVYAIITQSMGIVRTVLWMAMGFAGGLWLPIFLINRRIATRRQSIRAAMPDMLDFLCVSVQAGLGFDMALLKVTEKINKGPLVEEFQQMIRELRLGVARRQALQRLASRCGIEEMSLFTAALIQAETLGIGLAQVLEIQAENMRQWRRQAVKEQAAKLPVKILFPLVCCIFPAIFIVVLGPALLQIARSLLK